MALLNFTNLIRSIFNSENEGQSITKGHVVDELMVIPTSNVMTYFANEFGKIRQYNNLSEFNNITQEQLDILSSKFFINRVTGGKSYGYIRIFFDNKQEFEITGDTRFVMSDKNLSYQAVSPSVYGSESFKKSDSINSNYYVDVAVVSTVASDSYIIDAGDSFSINNSNALYKYAEATEDFISGQSEESNEELYKRLRNSLSDRNLINIKGLASMLREFFPSILSTHIVKAGDLEMRRDIVQIDIESSQGSPKDFKGKTTGSSNIPHIAYSDIFPPNVNSNRYDTYNPISQPASEDKPISVSNIQASNVDPAYHGFDLTSEYSDQQYSGLFFNNLDKSALIETENIISANNIEPSQWLVGSHYRKPNEIIGLESVDDLEISKDDVIQVTDRQIRFGEGATGSPVVLTRNIGKRTGIKFSGTIQLPDDGDSTYDNHENSSLNMYVASKGLSNQGDLLAFSGIGFGIKFYESDDNGNNTIFFIKHSEQYGSDELHISNENLLPDNIYSIKEKYAQTIPGESYDFEFILYDHTQGKPLEAEDRQYYGTLIFKNTNPLTSGVNEVKIDLPTNIAGILAKNFIKFNDLSNNYGEYITISYDSRNLKNENNEGNFLILSNLNVTDITRSAAMTMFKFTIKEPQPSLSIQLRVFAESYLSGVITNNFQTYIWNPIGFVSNNIDSPESNGLWELVPDLSNINSNRSPGELLEIVLDTVDNYSIVDSTGSNIYILVKTEGTNFAGSAYAGDQFENIQSRLAVFYSSIFNISNTYIHTLNKADLYVNTLSNKLRQNIQEIDLDISNDNKFILSNIDNPVQNVLSVYRLNNSGDTILEEIPEDEYVIEHEDPNLENSIYDVMNIQLINNNTNKIRVRYRYFPAINKIQTLFTDTNESNIFGDILVKHKEPVLVDLVIDYNGNSDENFISEEIREYVDANFLTKFSLNDLTWYLKNNNLVYSYNNTSMTYYDDDGNPISSNEATIGENRFFYINSLDVVRS